jgi:hypothetical protein
MYLDNKLTTTFPLSSNKLAQEKLNLLNTSLKQTIEEIRLAKSCLK